MQNQTEDYQNNGRGWIALNAWLDRLGRSETTGYRWRRRGWLNTTTIAGKHYLSPQNLADFERRAEAGEFATVPRGGAAPQSHSEPSTLPNER
jgi:hypothetical protein